MRNTIINTIFEYAKRDHDIILMTADLGYSVMEKFQQELSEQFINVGIAEQNMLGIAAGLALSGKKVFVYSISPFVTIRCLEQIKVDICYQNLDVTIIGVGGGFAYGTLGATHHAIEDIGIMRCLPNMKVIVPADPYEAKGLIEQIIKLGGPTYLRLNRGGEADLVSQNQEIHLGCGRILLDGQDVAILSCGAIASLALEVAELLGKNQISSGVISMHTIKPLDGALIQELLKTKKIIVSLEEHNVIGGLGSAISEIIARNPSDCNYISFGVSDCYPSLIGKQDYLRSEYIGSAENIAKKISSLAGKQ